MGLGGPDVVLFGIQAGLRLFGEARQAYVDRTRERSLTLPLPGLDHDASAEDALVFFHQTAAGQAAVGADARAAELSEHVDTVGPDHVDSALLQEFLWLYEYHKGVAFGTTMGDGLQPEDAIAALTIRQWNAGQGAPNALRRVAGTLVEIGIDYFATGPGVRKLAGHSPSKAIMRDVLTVLDDQDFQSAGLDGVVQTIFVATLESIGENPALVSGDKKTRLFVTSIAKGLADDVHQRLKGLDKDEALLAGDSLSSLAGLVFSSVMRSGADVVLNNPGTFFREVDEPGETALVQKMGTTLLDLVLAKDEDGNALQPLFTADTLDTIVKAALGVVAEHPDVLGLAKDEGGIRTVLAEIAGSLAKDTRAIGPDLFPELTRLVIERTGANLHLLWGADDDAENLALVAVRTLMGELAREPSAGAWKPRLSKSQVLNVAEAVLDELADNPQLILMEVDGRATLQDVISVVLQELSAKELDDLSGDTVVGILKVTVQAAAARWAFLEKLPGASGKTALAAVIDALFAAAGDEENATAAWTLAKGSVIIALLDVALSKLAEIGVTQHNIDALTESIAETQEELESGRFSVAEFAQRLEEAFQSEGGE